jgi:hypothetical protein
MEITKMISLQTAKRLSESTETSPEIFLAISKILKTDNELEIMNEWENGYNSKEVIEEAKNITNDEIFWGSEGKS